MSVRIVIVGGVAGGATAAARLRRRDEHATITMIERGPHISYANCGLPYHVGDVIKTKEELFLQTPEMFLQRYNIDARTHQEVTSINREQKSVTVKDLKRKETYTLPYDTLILATGSSPLKPPIPGIDSEGITTLWTVDDADNIRRHVQQRAVKHAVVVGGGFIGLEMTENLHQLGVEVTLVEMLPQVMAPFDYEMAQILHESLEMHGVKLHLNDGVRSFAQAGRDIVVSLASGKEIEANLVILAIGIRPNSVLARDAGLDINAQGGIVVNDDMRTSDPDIYAVGDVIEVEDFVDKSRTMIPLAGPANKQARIAADNILGDGQRYRGTQGTAVVKVFDMTAAATGANEKTLQKRGLVPGTDYEALLLIQNSHAGYYGGASPVTLKIIFNTDDQRILGAQIAGKRGVDKRIDVIATAMRLGASVTQLGELELAYAPPYSSAKDPVNMAGFVASNFIAGLVSFTRWDVLDSKVEHQRIILDVREEVECEEYAIPGAINIPLGQLRSQLQALDCESEIIVFCAVGVRAYNAARILMGHGFADVKVYPGGIRFYQSTHYKQDRKAGD